MLKHWQISCMLLAFSLVLPGCASTQDDIKAPYTAAPDLLPEGAYPEIVLLDGLERQLVREKLDRLVTEGANTLTIRVGVRSVIDYSLNVQYRILFFTADGSQVNDPVWKERVIQPRTHIVIEEMALTKKAEKFNLEIRRKQ